MGKDLKPQGLVQIWPGTRLRSECCPTNADEQCHGQGGHNQGGHASAKPDKKVIGVEHRVNRYVPTLADFPPDIGAQVCRGVRERGLPVLLEEFIQFLGIHGHTQAKRYFWRDPSLFLFNRGEGLRGES